MSDPTSGCSNRGARGEISVAALDHYARIAALDAARQDGVPVLGYIHWSLLDNFEWRRGYAQHFGLVAVDRKTFRRTPKPSAHLYSDMVRARS